MTTLALPNQPTLTVPWKRPEDDEEQTPQPSQPTSPAVPAPSGPKGGSAETPGMIGDPLGLVQTLGLSKPPIPVHGDGPAPQPAVSQREIGPAPANDGGVTMNKGGVLPVTYGGGQMEPTATDTKGSAANPAQPTLAPLKLPPMPVAPPPPPPPGVSIHGTGAVDQPLTPQQMELGGQSAGSVDLAHNTSSVPVLYGGGQMAPSRPGDPATGAGAPVTDDLESMLRNLLRNPYRYDQQAGEQAIHDRFGRQQEDANRSQDELYSSRGLVGSSVEAEGHRRTSEDIRNAEAGQLFDLQREMANTAGADRSAAAQIALALRGQGLQQQQMDEQIRQFNTSTAQQKEQFLAGLSISQQQVDQRATEIQNQAQQAGRSMTLAEAQAEAQTALAKEGLALQGKQLSQQGEQFQQQVAQRAQEIQLQAQQEGRRMTLAEAQSAAQTELAGKSFAESQRQYDESASRQREQFLASLGVEKEQVTQRAQEIANQASQEGRRMTLAEAQSAAQNELANKGFEEQKRQFEASSTQQRDQFLKQLGINQQQVDQEAQRIQQQESQFGRSLSTEEARFKAQQDLAERGFAEQTRQFGATMDQRDRQFDLDALLRLLQSMGFQ